MTGSQLKILKTGPINALNIYSPFPIRTVPLGNQMIDGWELLLKKLSQLLNENKIIELELHHFAAISEVVDLDIKHH